MPRLPAPLEPAFPLVKRAHRLATRRVGAVTRRAAARRPGPRSVPAHGTDRSVETAALEPGAVRIHPGGPGEQLRRSMPQGTPEGHWFFEQVRRFDVPARFTLEIDQGLVVGRDGAHITPGGILDYETSTYFGVDGWREHPIYLRRRLPEPQRVDGSLLSLATRGTWGNYYHVLMDLLPRLGVFRECLPDVRPDRYLVNRNTTYARELLELVGLGDAPTLEPGRHTAYRAERLFVPCINNPHTRAPQWTTDWLRANLPPRRTAGLPRRLYVTRGTRRHTRRVDNEAEVVSLLSRHGFTVFDPGAHPVQDQIDHFAAAEVIVAPHGAGLSNLNFCRPGVRVLELFAPGYLNPGYWAITANIPGSVYRYLVAPAEIRPEGTVMNRVYDDLTVPRADLESALADLLGTDATTSTPPPTQEDLS